ncbi:MAG: hypothetical protein RL329_3314 [Bacteroidota bacterium]|jgi:hypothetical protein
MKLSELKMALNAAKSLNFVLPNGKAIPAHFHITEVGLSSKHFIDCGNSVHVEKWANFQIWVSVDMYHRLKPTALLKIIESSNMILGDEDLEVEIEYQTETVGKYALAMQGETFTLVPRQTDCLAKETCFVPQVKQKVFELVTVAQSCCTPGGGCC